LRSFAAALGLAAALALGSGAQAKDRTVAGTASVIDGDTIEIHGQRIRLYGIDAPESRQTCSDASGHPYRCGQKAAIALSDRIGRAPVDCRQRDIDRYGRIVAICYKDGEDLNAWMVRQGWAVAYTRCSDAYVRAQAAAEAEHRGIWQGEFTPPEAWRRAQRESRR
jgi:endonuclease YncB( thermonuclease family)